MYSFLALFTLVLIASICKGLHDNTCRVVPKDQYIEVGSDTKVVCQTSCIRGKIFWTLDNRHINESLSSTINSTHTVLSLRNFTNRSATLQCHSAATQQVLGGTTIRTYSKPSKLSCLLHHDNQATQGLPDLFTCSWEHQIDPPLEINYTVLCDSWSCPPQSEICSSHQTTCTSNYVDISDKMPLAWPSSVVVIARSAAWNASSDPYEFNPFNILKITRPNVSVVAVSDHLSVEWNVTSFSERKLHCQVKYAKAADEGTPEWVLNMTLETKEEKGEMSVENVESCRNYTFAVRCALAEAPWSDWSQERTVLTKLNKGDVELHLWRKVAEADRNGVRKVHAMWTEIPSTCQDTFTYTVRQTPYREHVTGGNHTDTLCGSSVCDIDVNQDAHRINLRIFHDDFLFVEDSVYVPSIGESLPRVTDIRTSTLERVILVSWKAHAQPVSGYMIDYTHDGNQYHWKQTTYTNATLFDLLDKKPYDITVTPLFGDKTGHGTQALPTCSRVGDPGNVTITELKAKDKSVLVRWTVKSQEACSGVVVDYTIFYGTQEGPPLNVTVESTTQDIILKGLNPETQYRVYIKATALTGTSKSSERLFKTKRFDPRLSAALGVSGGILIVLVLSLGLCCAIQWQKFKEKPVPDPGNSSVALWSSTSHEKGICPFQPFHNPSESFCDRIYTAEAQRPSTSPPAAGSNDNPDGDQNMREEYGDPATVLAPHIQNEVPAEPVETHHPSFPGETTELLCSEDSPSSPYQSQRPVETPALRISKQCMHVPVKQQEKTPPLTVYVTLDMFEQGQGR
ncbi:interleukin-31 receptor subunit alpha-like [Chelmon rostratus]|uniref:interleukin-31 receptor subunit alpha-like n=1 Tax=Chelmon rostratus TaxID=109905 RepID=UPI001BE9780D|nr:interleukin-31 receptor subunit alpha-like [Chelmon rostratus]